MEWHKLELTKASVIKKEVDHVINILNEAATTESSNKSAIVNAVQARIQELENFYIRNNDDERAILFEKERLRLRKALQSISTSNSRDGRSVSGVSTEHAATDFKAIGEPRSGDSVHSGSRVDRSVTSQSKSQQSHSTTNPRISRITTPLGVKSVASGTASVASSKKSPSKQPLYAWEDPNIGNKHGAIVIENNMFIPTATNGFYDRQDNNRSSFSLNDPSGGLPMAPLSDKYCDFQIVLTHEELTTLASRKKSDRPDAKLHRSQAASMSVHSSTPYVDSRRIQKSLMRPDNPEKWIHPEGMRPYKKVYN